MKKLLFATALMLVAVPALAQGGATQPAGEFMVAQSTVKGLPHGTGEVVSVDAANHTVKMKHDPIAALGWPTMTMLFNVDSSVDLSGYQPGDAVSFTLKPANDDYLIVEMKKK